MSMQIYNGGIFGGILKIIKESDERDGTSSLSQEDLEYMDYLETLPKNVCGFAFVGDLKYKCLINHKR